MSFSADGKLLATGCDDNNAYTWDVSEIIRDTGCNQLLNTNVSVPVAFLISQCKLNAPSQDCTKTLLDVGDAIVDSSHRV